MRSYGARSSATSSSTMAPRESSRSTSRVSTHTSPHPSDRLQRLDRAVKSHAVVIAGGGPTGLMLAAELTLAGVDVVVVERRVNQELSRPGGLGLYSRTIEVFDQRGIAERFVSEGQKYPAL